MRGGDDRSDELTLQLLALNPLVADGGGFKVVTSTPQYVYVQFESYKNGYIDDFEVAQRPNTSIFDVRSSSRIGYLDYGVNAKRINYIASRLKSEKKWSAPGVDLQKFQVRLTKPSNGKIKLVIF